MSKKSCFRIDRLSALEICDMTPILPFGNSLSVTVGNSLDIYCIPKLPADEVSWVFPNATGNPRKVFKGHEMEEFRKSSNPSYYLFQSPFYGSKFYKPRIAVHQEKLR